MKDSNNKTERIVFTVQIIILLTSVFFGIESLLGSLSFQAKTAFSETTRQVARELAVQSEPSVYFKLRLLPMLFNKPDSHRLPLDRIHAILDELWGVKAFIYLFDSRGNLTATIPEDSPNKWLIRQLYPGLTLESGVEFDNIRKQLDRRVPTLLGHGKGLVSLRKDRLQLVEVYQRGETGIFGWNQWGEDGGIILHVPSLASDIDVFKRISSRFPAEKIAIKGMRKVAGTTASDWESTTVQWLRDAETPDDLAEKAFNKLDSQQLKEGEAFSLWWNFVETASGRIVYAAVALRPGTYLRTRSIFRCIALLLFLSALLAIFKFNIPSAIPLGRFLLVLFLASSLIPMLAIAIGSLDMAEVYQSLTGTRINTIQEEALSNLAQDFETFLARKSSLLIDITSPDKKGSPPSVDSMVDALWATELLENVQFRDAGSNLIYGSEPYIDQGTEAIHRSLTHSAISRFMPDRLGEKPYAGEIFTDTLVGKDDMGIATALNHPSKLQVGRTGPREFLYFFRVFPRDYGEAAFMQLWLSPPTSIRRHLETWQQSNRASYLGVNIRFFAFHSRNFSWVLPPPDYLRDELRKAVLRALVTSQNLSTRISTPDGGGFVFVMPVSRLTDHCLIAFYPDDRLKETMEGVRFKLIAAAVIFLFLISLVGKVISNQFVSPLHFLSDGLAALGMRDFAFRLPPAGYDEIGNLFTTFNEMMEESKDLQVARTVQEGLVPQKFPQPEGFSIYATLETASDLGGDCLGCFEMETGKIFFLVGDITGHGVASALVMAFSRAVTFHWSQRPEGTPSSLADQLDHMLRAHHNSKLFMGIVCGILDPVSGEIEFIVRGHIYPLILKADKSAEWIGSPALPLGLGKKGGKERIFKVTLNRGDSMLCCTDGFIEGICADSQPIGYPRFEQWAAATRCPDAREWIKQMFELFHKTCGKASSDDLTLLALHRLEKQE